MSLLESFRKHLAQTSDSPIGLEIVRAEGVWLYDASGKKYLDAISGVCVNNLGHRHPVLVSAIEQQLERYMHTMVYGEFVLEEQVHLAEKLASLLPPSLSVSYFVNSGSEAVEGALKLARRFTGRKEIVCFENCYHGSTMGALSLSSSTPQRFGFEPLLSDVTHLPFNDVQQLNRITERTACAIVEPIQGEAGVIEATPEFLLELRQRCTDVGAMMILDEVQTGLGRTGKMFAFEHYKVVPDVLILGKALGGGLPLAAFISSQDIMSCLKDPPLGHITTFGGNPLTCAAALAMLDVISQSGFLDHVNAMGDQIRQDLRHAVIKEIRGRGLMLAVELGSEEVLQRVLKRCLENGVVTDWFLFASRCLRICPPLVISKEETTDLYSVVLSSLAESG